MSLLVSLASALLAQGQPGAGSDSAKGAARDLMVFRYEQFGGFLGDSQSFQLMKNGVASAERTRFGNTERSTQAISAIEALHLERWVELELSKARVALWDCDGADQIHHRFEAKVQGEPVVLETCDPDPELSALIARIQKATASLFEEAEDPRLVDLRFDLPKGSAIAAAGLELRASGNLSFWTLRDDGDWHCGGAIRVDPDTEEALRLVIDVHDHGSIDRPGLQLWDPAPNAKGTLVRRLDLSEPNVLELLRQQPILIAVLREVVKRG